MTDAIIDHLIHELKTFRQQHPLASELNDTYQSAPIELMVRTFLNVFLDPARTEEAADTIARTALDNGIPYAVLLGDINVIKQALLTHYRGQNDNPVDLFEKLDAAFETTKNAIARRYLIDLAGQNALFHKARIRNQRLLEIYSDWFDKLRSALQDERLDAFRALSQNNQSFIETLQHPETLMVCMDDNACTEVMEQHKGIMRQAMLLYAKLLEKRYEQALLLYTELRAAIKQMASLLTTLYFNYETNQLSLFFNLLSNLPYLHKAPYLTLVNVRHLNRINQIEGQERGDEILQQVNHALQQLVATHHEHFAYVRGLQGDFYLISVDLDGPSVQSMLNDWLHTHTPEIQIALTTVNLKYIDYHDRPNLRYLIQYLHQFRSQDRTLINSKEDAADANRWIREQLEMSINLKKLLEPGNLSIEVQPLFDILSQDYAAFEVLGRLQHEHQTLSAGIFIDRLIELGLIEQFDSMILELICQQAAELRELTDTLFINASPASLRQPAYQNKLREAIQGALSGLNIIVELTEQVMLEEPDFVRHLQEEVGVQFAVDDFGSGYASLRSVVDLSETGALRFLKIDGSLTQQLENSSRIRRLFGIIQGLADDLDVKTVAEFIENQRTLEILKEERIDYGQGFFLGKPMPVRAWLVQKLYQVD